MFFSWVVLAFLISLANGSPASQREVNPCTMGIIEVSTDGNSAKSYKINRQCFEHLARSAAPRSVTGTSTTVAPSVWLRDEVAEVSNTADARAYVEPLRTTTGLPIRKTYVIHKHNATWQAAWNNCKAENKELVTVKSAEEQRSLMQLLIRSRNLTPFLWLGGTDPTVHRDFTWVHSDRALNTEVQYENWQTGQPDRADRSCMQICSTSGKWYDADCSREYAYYVCEDESGY